MANCTLETSEKRIDELYDRFVRYINKADCQEITIFEAAGKDNLHDIDDELCDILTILLSDSNRNRKNLLDRITVLARSVEQAMEECTF
ncbi:hypothetical protein IKF67_01885 [Candidatus Saccharibacteria bacterium]|nr:hypothetical protein [Candidatus Saccharibacteria bacterium]